jgi:hypothetical protein
MIPLGSMQHLLGSARLNAQLVHTLDEIFQRIGSKSRPSEGFFFSDLALIPIDRAFPPAGSTL